MSNKWKYQIRINLDDDLAKIVRGDPDNTVIKPLADILSRHNSTIKCQFDAFADYVSDALEHGKEKYPLYEWTKETIEDPVKKEKYIKSFALYVDGDEGYTKEKADALEADLQQLVHSRKILQLFKHDTNPANNPQPPPRHR